MEFVKRLQESIEKHVDHNVLCINGVFYTYQDFALEISKIRLAITTEIEDSEKLIGLVTNDDLLTYASIIALWLEGKAYVPVNPEVPFERNAKVFELTETKYVLDSSDNSVYKDYRVIASKGIVDTEINLTPKQFSGDQLAYILFTSGTTGLPKGVPITFDNVQALVGAIDVESTFNLIPSDRCLQMFELTFDFSVVTYLFPLLSGSCMYTIPKGAIKYFYIFKLINEEKLTVLTMVPSIINYLRPYFGEINAPDVRYCSFGGGALHSDIAKEWSDCLPNCKIFNYYGPTEFTVYSGFYPYHKNTDTKSHNGIIAIGTPQQDTLYLVVDENNEEVVIGETGELCLGGPQITPGYWKNEERNAQSFFMKNENGKSVRYYKTGDLCLKDEEGDFLYVGRADFQVKIRGYRVELAEIEFHAKFKSEQKVNMVALDITNALGNAELGLAIESEEFDSEYIFDYMKIKMPSYMIPMHVRFIKEFPHSINGKIDRKELRKHFNIN
ncbi:amino acid adenylation domain-containing protein [Aquimarina amphilecti]|uniref:Amino acid adenylation domain-containing protein n=1 Tax=Aquimarina amphilecti TaxID=1038014 RepID=A0A1H7HTT2_AQUAM|nr:AMP-binding protein [Aquimarina amphilecti]SEK53057.1 amino acid adenylation domain-containing protein [Aquimarina amphilecti]